MYASYGEFKNSYCAQTTNLNAQSSYFRWHIQKVGAKAIWQSNRPQTAHFFSGVWFRSWSFLPFSFISCFMEYHEAIYIVYAPRMLCRRRRCRRDAPRRWNSIPSRVQFRLNKASYTSPSPRIFPRCETSKLNALNVHLMVQKSLALYGHNHCHQHLSLLRKSLVQIYHRRVPSWQYIHFTMHHIYLPYAIWEIVMQH